AAGAADGVGLALVADAHRGGAAGEDALGQVRGRGAGSERLALLALVHLDEPGEPRGAGLLAVIPDDVADLVAVETQGQLLLDPARQLAGAVEGEDLGILRERADERDRLAVRVG